MHQKPWYKEGFVYYLGVVTLFMTGIGYVQYNQYCKEQEIIDNALIGNRAAMRIMQIAGPHWFNSNRFKESAMAGNPYALEIMGLEKK